MKIMDFAAEGHRFSENKGPQFQDLSQVLFGMSLLGAFWGPWGGFGRLLAALGELGTSIFGENGAPAALMGSRVVPGTQKCDFRTVWDGML